MKNELSEQSGSFFCENNGAEKLLVKENFVFL